MSVLVSYAHLIDVMFRSQYQIYLDWQDRNKYYLMAESHTATLLAYLLLIYPSVEFDPR